MCFKYKSSDQWYCYLKERQNLSPKIRFLIYNHALKMIPNCHKLWHSYLEEKEKIFRSGHSMFDRHLFVEICQSYERALLSSPKVSHLWIKYLKFMDLAPDTTSMKRVFDRALQVLPNDQHHRVWTLYLKFLRSSRYPAEKKKKVYTRYIMSHPDKIEEYIVYMKDIADWDEVATSLMKIINDTNFQSNEAKTHYQFWIELCDIITKKRTKLSPIQVETLIRNGISKFTIEAGSLWLCMADYYVRQGYFERARDLYEDGMLTVTTKKDFNKIFDAYVLYQQSILKFKMDSNYNKHSKANFFEDGVELDIYKAKMKYLIRRRPDLQACVILRQNPLNVFEWFRRIQLYNNQPGRQISILLEALAATHAFGGISSLWLAFANFYERHADITNARSIFQKAASISYSEPNGIIDIYDEWVAMELRNKREREARKLLRIALWMPINYNNEKLSAQKSLYQSSRLWNLLSDLEETHGSLDCVRMVQNRMLSVKVSAPQNIVNFAQILLDKNLYEEAFQVYERGLGFFRGSYSMDIWQIYLLHFMNVYKGTRRERTREIFEQALISIPYEGRKMIYLLYAYFEETFGTAERSILLYKRSARSVPREARLELYNICVEKTYRYSGISGVREIFEIALQSRAPYQLYDHDIVNLCLQYADLESSVGELDRARAIYIYASRLVDERTDKVFWRKWFEFEIKNGNEISFRDMLRLKRSIKASFKPLMDVFD
eukprot:gnl/MRDRNA2_/MRDRNA2_86657_c0_seq1.p1 gnl/MRDRNA2_/MRDRNA2_86657_c0~~gnl/MRDRNA2_/MRDRNA2_86657_c0_seq1.p1  ORF type:complete len:721 (-),score=7.07 gnl/MRDRNA2_/MRDRNA2_86657_c0_seq1:481-2643(-)